MRLALLLQPGRAVDEEPRGVDLGRHVGQLPLDRLEVGDPLAELLALQRVGARRVVGGLRDAERLRRDPDPPAVERRHRDREALPLVVQHAVAVDERVLDRDRVRHRRVEAELLLAAGHADVLRIEDERRDAARARRVRVGAREQEKRPRVLGGGDELLRARDPPAVTVLASPTSGASRHPNPPRSRSARTRRSAPRVRAAGRIARAARRCRG